MSLVEISIQVIRDRNILCEQKVTADDQKQNLESICCNAFLSGRPNVVMHFSHYNTILTSLLSLQ